MKYKKISSDKILDFLKSVFPQHNIYTETNAGGVQFFRIPQLGVQIYTAYTFGVDELTLNVYAFNKQIIDDIKQNDSLVIDYVSDSMVIIFPLILNTVDI